MIGISIHSTTDSVWNGESGLRNCQRHEWCVLLLWMDAVIWNFAVAFFFLMSVIVQCSYPLDKYSYCRSAHSGQGIHCTNSSWSRRSTLGIMFLCKGVSDLRTDMRHCDMPCTTEKHEWTILLKINNSYFVAAGVSPDFFFYILDPYWCMLFDVHNTDYTSHSAWLEFYNKFRFVFHRKN